MATCAACNQTVLFGGKEHGGRRFCSTAFTRLIYNSETSRISVANYLELSMVIEKQIGPEGSFRHALDLGTGTGKSLAVLEPCAESVTGIDQNEHLLSAAKEVAGPNTVLVQGSVASLPFEDGSFDLIASSGLTGALDRDTSVAFYKELARVMADNGIYIEGSYMPNEEGYMGEEMARIVASSKAMLSDMIVDTVSGKLELKDYLEYEDKLALFDEIGLRQELYVVANDDGMTESLITVITK